VLVAVTVPFEVTVDVTGASVIVKMGPPADTVVMGPGRKTVEVKSSVDVAV